MLYKPEQTILIVYLGEGANIYQERKEDLSIYYWLKDKFSASPSVNIVDGFPAENLVLPTISIEWKRIEGTNFELGNRDWFKRRLWYIDVFATNKSQRDEFAYKIMNEVSEGIPVYDYDLGFPPAVTPTKLGILIPESVSLDMIKIIPELVDKMYYRSTVMFMAYYDRTD